MKHSEILREAKKRLWGGVKPCRANQSSSICFAISLAARTAEDTDKACEIRVQIGRVLGKHTSVRRWLNRHVGIPEELLTDRNMQEYRHRWLDELIRIYEEAGK